MKHSALMTVQSHPRRSTRSAGLAGFWWTQFLARLDARRTHRILSSLDPEVLEDIGVPHTNVRPSAGLLERHPHVIAITMWKI